MVALLRSTIVCFSLGLVSTAAVAQTTGDGAAVRVTMSVNEDGSRTVYKFDDAARTAVATATNADGKVRQRIRYQLDEAGRFRSAEVFGPDGKLRMKTRYKYNEAGRLEEETQLSEADAVLYRIVYNYDAAGKTSSYSVLDADGKLLNRVSPLLPSAPAAAAARQKSSKR